MSTLQEGSIKKIARNYQLVNIIKPEGDSREFRGLILPNKLKVVLISDPRTRRTNAALEVGVGYLCEPVNIPGLANLMGHTLFSGTQKYPDFLLYIMKNFGTYTALTYPEKTIYDCEITSRIELNGFLDRFAQLFIAPLFHQSDIKFGVKLLQEQFLFYKELNGITSHVVMGRVMDQKHPFSHYSKGNKVSLEETPEKEGIDIRHELCKFFETWYSSNIMTLVVYGKDSLDELEKMVVEKFSDIKNRNVILPKWSKKLFRDEDNTAIQIILINEPAVNELIIYFKTNEIPWMLREYIEYIFSYNGRNSLSSELLERGWIQGTSVETGFMAFHNVICWFRIVIYFTEDGIDHADEVVTLIFQYINLVKKEGPQKWIFDDICKWQKAHFDSDIQKRGYAMQHILKMIRLYSFEDNFSLSENMDWHPNLIENFLNELVPSNCFTIVSGKKFDSLCTETEPWYNLKYTYHKISREVLEKWENCGLNENFKFPSPNPFTPTEVHIRPIKIESEDGHPDKPPKIIYDTPIMRIWHKQNYNPRMNIAFEFLKPAINTDPLLKIMSDILIALFNDYIKDDMILINQVEANVQIHTVENGICISIKGYNGLQMKILEFILKNLFNFTINESLFEKLKEDTVRNFESKKSASGKMLALTTLNLILSERQWSPQDCLDVIQLITVGKLQKFMLDYLSQIYVEGITSGNINRSQTLEMADFIKKFLGIRNSCPVLSSCLLLPREHKLCNGDNYLYEINTEFHGNSCTLIYFQCQYKTDTTVALLHILHEIMDVFIKQERFRYDVDLIYRVESGSTGLIFTAETTKHPALVEDRIEKFLKSFLIEIQALSQEKFEKYKHDFIMDNLADLVPLLPYDKPDYAKVKMEEFFNKEYHFTRAIKEEIILQDLDKEQLLNYFKTNFLTSRRCLSIYVISTLEQIPQDNFECKRRIDKIQESKVKITDINLFKCTRGFFPCPKTHREIKSKGMEHKF